MSTIIPDVQVLDASNVWQSAIAGLQACQISGGIQTSASKPEIGRAELLWYNASQAYNPDPAGGTSALLRAWRRLRVTATTDSQGYILRVIHDGAADLGYWSQVVTTGTSIADVWTLTWEARAQFDSMYNADQVYIVTSGESQAPTVYTYTNKWVTYSLTFTATATGTTIAPRLRPHFAGNNVNSTAIEYRNLTLKKGAGANVLVNGNLSTGLVTPWTNTNSGGSTCVLAVLRDYRILFNGRIIRVEPAPFQRAGEKTSRVIAVDFVNDLKRQKLTGLALQKDQRGDQLVIAALALLPTNNVSTTYPGRFLDLGKQVFSRAFDGYTKETALYDALTDTAMSEFSLWWVDPDGTLRWVARDYPLRRLADPVALTLVGGDASTKGQPFDMHVIQDAMTVVNKTVITWHPRSTIVGPVVLGQITSAVQIPPIQLGGAPGEITVTLTFRDPATQALCGGDGVITPLVATTDYRVYDNADPTAPWAFEYTSTVFFTITVMSVDASQLTVKLQNSATGPLWATTLQVRGAAVVAYDPQTMVFQDDTAIAVDGESAWTKDLPFNDDSNFVSALGMYLVNRLKTPLVYVDQVSVDWRATLGGVDVLSIEPMDVVSISDVQAGLTTPLKHLILHWIYLFTPQAGDYLGNVTWGLERLDDKTYAILDDPVLGVLDVGDLLFI